MREKRRFVSLYIILIIVMAIGLNSCHTSRDQEAAPATEMGQMAPVQVVGASNKYIPKAVIYQTNGDYNKNVMIVLNPARNKVLTYPDMIDVSAKSEPIELGDGWLLDRRGGISTDSGFLTYTYPEYAALKKVPSTKELLSHLIPGARVTRCVVLPINIIEATADPESVKKYIPKD